MKKLLPLILLVIGIGAGVGAGVLLKPRAEQDPAQHEAEASAEIEAAEADPAAIPGEIEYIALNNQFVVPIIDKTETVSLVVLSLGIEMEAGQSDAVYQREPKLRDELLQVLFDHANFGGFNGRFTDSGTMDGLRLALTESAQAVLGPTVRGVIITQIARQDV